MAYILSCNKKKMTGLVLLKVLPKLLEAKFMLVNLAISRVINHRLQELVNIYRLKGVFTVDNG